MALASAERRTIAALGLGLFCVQVDFFALTLALPRMAVDFDRPTTDLQWVISAYMIAIGATLIPAGRLGDLLGRRRMTLVGLVIFGAGSLACGLSPTLPLLVGVRALQGVGSALLLTVGVAALSNAVTEARRAAAIGLLFGLANIGTALGPFIGGLLTETAGWRWVFLINVPLILLALVLCSRWMPESRDETATKPLDLVGLLLIVASVATVTFAADRADAWGWLSSRTLGTLAAGLLLLAGFVAYERRADAPLIDMSLFRNRAYVQIVLGGTVSNIAYAVAVLATTLYLQQGRGLSPLVAGVVFLAPSIAVALSGPLSGRLASKYRVPILIPAALLLGAVSLLVVSSVATWWLYLAALGLAGLALGMGWSLPNIGAQLVVVKERAGAAAGVALASMVTAGGVAVALAATMIESYGTGGPSGYEDATSALLRIVAVTSMGAAVVLLALALRTRPAPSADGHRGLEGPGAGP